MFSHKPSVFDVEWLSRQQLKLLENCSNRDDCRLTMKLLFVSTVAVVLLVGCKSTRQTTFQTPSISIHEAAEKGNVEAIKKEIEQRQIQEAKTRENLESLIKQLNKV